MKKIIVSIVLSLIVATVAAQTNYYPDNEGTISRPGYTYRYRPDGGRGDHTSNPMVQLFNTDNKFIDVKFARKDGSELSYEDRYGAEDGFHDISTNMTNGQFSTLVKSCFSAHEMTILKGSFVHIECRIDTSTGKVSDVYFGFFRIQPAMYIPVETYRKVELAIKQNLSAKITAEGQRLNYIGTFHKQRF